MSAKILCRSLELELLHRFVPRKQLILDICLLDFGVILASHLYVVYIEIGDSESVFLYNYCILVAKSMWGGWRRKLCPSGKSSS